MVFRAILPKWACDQYPTRRKVVEGEFTDDQITQLNDDFYNIYFLPNSPSLYDSNKIVDGSQIDIFDLVFIDMDLKDGVYKSKEQFIDIIKTCGLDPTLIVDSGNGVHVYWKVSDLTAMTFLHIQRRLIRKFNTDEAVGQLFQLMRYPGTLNTKFENEFKPCQTVYTSGLIYTSEDLDNFLPALSSEDEQYCKQHYDKTHRLEGTEIKVNEQVPLKFTKLIQNNREVKEIWVGNVDDRSKGDYRLGHIMHASGFTRDEATSVLVNMPKALGRAPVHRIGYATGIVDKIWVYEETQDKDVLDLSMSVKDILNKKGDKLSGTRFPCWRYIDATQKGFRLGQIVGLVAGSGVGKTAMALNMFEGFVQSNPEYDHFFIPLEQPSNEIAERWKVMCGDNVHLYDKVHVISNYNEDGSFRHLSFDQIKDYILKFQEVTKRSVGCVVIDHIGALNKKGQQGENQDLMNICHQMKAFAIATNTMLVMQSQAPREKAGIGDLELNKDAAYGTVFFESYCDYLITMWQPLKRMYSAGAPTVTAFKFCKIRHKNQKLDDIQEDVCYKLLFDPTTEHMRPLNEEEEKQFSFFLTQATNKRKLDRKTDIIEYQGMHWMEGEQNGTIDNNKDSRKIE